LYEGWKTSSPIFSKYRNSRHVKNCHHISWSVCWFLLISIKDYHYQGRIISFTMPLNVIIKLYMVPLLGSYRIKIKLSTNVSPRLWQYRPCPGPSVLWLPQILTFTLVEFFTHPYILSFLTYSQYLYFDICLESSFMSAQNPSHPLKLFK
jgi:hypothetical protein